MDLHSFRTQSEAFWARHRPRTLAPGGLGGTDWQTGTRWQPYAEAQITAAEARDGRPFPAPYRAFLAVLGRPDRPQLGFGYRGAELVQSETHLFPDWTDPEDIARRREAIVQGLLFDVAQGIWPGPWGTAPPDAQKEAHLRARIAAAPPLLPLWLHRVLPSTEDAGPVLSIHQTDVIPYGATLAEALLRDFGPLWGTPSPVPGPVSLPQSYGFWKSLVEATL